MMIVVIVVITIMLVLILNTNTNQAQRSDSGRPSRRPRSRTPNFPTNIIPTQIARLKLSWKSPMGLGIPHLKVRLCLSQTLSNP